PNSGGKAALIYCPGIGGNTEKIILSDQPVTDGAWHMITGVISRNNTMKLYIDGILQIQQADISNSSTVNIGAGTFNAAIGVSYCYFGVPNNLNEFFQGTIDEVGIWMRSLNQCEIWAIYFEKISGSFISVTSCDSYISPSGIYLWEDSGMYTDTLTSFQGCDSIITIDLTIKHSTETSFSVSACDSYTASDGSVYSESGVITAVIPNSSGCDSTLTIDLTILKSSSDSVFIFAYDSYTAPDGSVYKESGIITNIIPNSAGCDSTITIEFFVFIATDTIPVTACDSYLAPDGTLHTTSGFFSLPIPTATGYKIVGIDLIIVTLDAWIDMDRSMLTAQPEGAEYTWVNCSEGYAIEGETSRQFIAPANGSYAVVVTNGPCVDTSACQEVTGVGFAGSEAWNISVYPNPVMEQLNIEIKGDANKIKYVLFSINGIVLRKGYFTGQVVIPTENLMPGLYILRIETGKDVLLRKVMKE
ncbi:MAG: T9SS type A sorting domain-containing protein, partial [Bacteroidales bacterium]|nr:T9SS type A sorting domain-containing protein [Bacteroidales bacterium]